MVAALDFRKHLADAPRRKRMLDRGANSGDLGISVAKGFAPPGEFKGLADPLGNGHTSRTRGALHLAVLGILKNYLQPLSHGMSVSDSLR